MLQLILDHLDEIAVRCRRHGVSRLEIFGSAAVTDNACHEEVKCDFDPAKSDLDFLVEFDAMDKGSLADRYFGLLFDRQNLFGRKVDLVMPEAIENPYFKAGVDKTRRSIHAA